jgi:RNA polymerase sigma-70 factor (ECF subfamily)
MPGRSAANSAKLGWPDDAARGASLMAPLSDDELVAAAQGGDRNALDQLLRRHYDRIYAVCRRVTGGSRDADDACQEALIKITRSLPRFDGRSAFGTWAYRIATNASLDELRKRKRRPMLHSVHPGDGRNDQTGQSGDDGPPELVDPMAAKRIDAVADRLALDDALDDLSDNFKAAVVLRDVADLDYNQIADILEIPIGTVKSRIARGRAALADTLRLDDLLDKPSEAVAEVLSSTPTDVTSDFSDPGNQHPLSERPTDSP